MNKKFYRQNKHSRGQTLPYMLAMMLVLIICWSMLVNIAKFLNDRMMMQNAADNAALSVAVYKARVLNELGRLNYLLASTLYDGKAGLTAALLGEEPLGIFNYDGKFSFSLSSMIRTISSTDALSIITLLKDSFSDGGPVRIPRYSGPYNTCAAKFRPISPAVVIPPFFLVRRMSDYDSQEQIACISDMYNGRCSGTLTRIDLSGNNRGVEFIRKTVDAIIAAQKSFSTPFPPLALKYANDIGKRQQVNSRGEFCGADFVVVSPASLSLGLKRNENGIGYCKTKHLCVSLPGTPVYPPGTHTHVFWSDEYKKGKKSWFFADNRTFSKYQIIKVLAVKRGNSDSNRGYPVLGRWLGIRWPDIVTSASAATYNTTGPMFPVEDAGDPSNQISPVIGAYLQARHGGWYAHLIPDERGS
ncbi:Tad domain-containing protein [Elusimicrobiota bacterium]